MKRALAVSFAAALIGGCGKTADPYSESVYVTSPKSEMGAWYVVDVDGRTENRSVLTDIGRCEFPRFEVLNGGCSDAECFAVRIPVNEIYNAGGGECLRRVLPDHMRIMRTKPDWLK